MNVISLPLGRGMRLAGPVFVLGVAALVCFCPFVYPWRILAVGTVLVAGSLIWIRYLRRRPVRITVSVDGAINCELADGSSFEVERIIPGIVRPCLLSSRLTGAEGKYGDLFVPAGSLSETTHWQLRRALTGFHPSRPQSDERRGV